MVYKFFDERSSSYKFAEGIVTRTRSETLDTRDKSTIKSEDISNQQLAEELHMSNMRKPEKREVYWPFKDNILEVDLADLQLMQLISKFIKKIFRFLFCVIDIYAKYAWVSPLKDKKGITITNAFQKI